MKSTEEVCRQFGFEYAPVRTTKFKQKLQLRSLTPKTEQEIRNQKLLRDILILMGIAMGFLFLVIGACAIAFNYYNQ